MSSKVVDERVVEMSFDNAKFERGVAQSRASMEGFKQMLNFSDSKKSLEEYQKAMKNTDVSGLSSAVDTVKVKLSGLNVMAMTMIQDLTRSAVNAGKRIVDALAFDSIKDGYNEYNLKMGSIQTIMMSTGESLQTVNKYLDELNTYSDRTIYSFSDMTQNIGKFTNAGVKLEDAVAAIKGVSNEAAISGANANEASRAMYNFAQALSAGYVKLIDWKSIENANMATMDFKNQLIETAAELGTVKKKGDQYVSVTKSAKGSTSDAFDAVRGFNDSLTYQWMTTDVLVKTLQKYTDETTELGKKAYAAASEFKTFAQMWDAWKEAAGSGWAGIWQNIFGDFNEAKQLWGWTNRIIGDYITNIFAAKNATLEAWKEGGGRYDLIEAALNSLEALAIILKIVKTGVEDVFPPKTSKDLIKFTKRLKELTKHFKITEKNANNLRSTVKGLASIFKIVKGIVGGGLKISLKVLSDIFGVTFTNVLDLTGALGENIYAFEQLLEKYNVFKVASDGVIWGINKIEDGIKFLVNLIRNADFTNNALTALGDNFGYVGDTAMDLKDIVIKNFTEFTTSISKNEKKLTFKTVLDAITKLGTEIGEFFTGVNTVTNDGVTGFENLRDKTVDAFGKMCDGAEVLRDKVGTNVAETISRVAAAAQKIPYKSILQLIAGIGAVRMIWRLGDLMDKLAYGVERLVLLPGQIGGSFLKLLNRADKTLKTLQNDIRAHMLKNIAISIGLLAASLWVLSKIPKDDLTRAAWALGGIVGAVAGLIFAMGRLGAGQAADAVRNSALLLVGITASVLILVKALKQLEGVNWGDLLPGVIALSGLMGALALVLYAISQSKSEAAASAAGVAAIIAVAVSLKLLVSSLKDLLNLDYDNWKAALGSAVGVVVAFTVLMLAVGKASKIAETSEITGAATMIGMVIALKGIISLIDDITKLDTKAIIDNIWSFVAVFVALGVLLKMSSIAGENAAQAGVLIVGVGVGIKLIVSALQTIGGLDPKVKKNAMTTIFWLDVFFAALIGVSHFAGENAHKAGIMLLLASGSIAVLSMCISALSELDPSGLFRATAAIDTMILCFTAMVAFSSKAADVKGMKLTMVALAAVIAVMAGSIGILSALDQNAVTNAANVMIKVGLVFTAMMAVMGILGKLKGFDAIGLVTLGVMGVIVGLLGYCMYELAQLPLENVANVGDALSKALLSISAALGILSLIPIPAAAASLLSLSIFIGGLVGILSILGGLSKIDGFNELIGNGSGVLSQIGSALGGFVGSVIDGIADKATENMPTFATRLSEFMTNLQPFITGAKQIDGSIVESMASIVGVVLAITAAEVIDGIGRFLLGGSSMESFGKELYAFGLAFKGYADTIKGIDASAVTGSAQAAKALADFAEAIPEDGGIEQWITGSKDMSAFAEQLIPFGEAFKKYAAAVSGIDPKVVINSTMAATSLAAFKNALPKTGGFESLFKGSKSLIGFAIQLVPFGAAFKAYANTVKGVDTNAVVASAAAAQSLAMFNRFIPNQGGLKTLFTGTKSIALWGTQLVSFGVKFRLYAATVKGIDTDVVNTSTAAARSLAAFANEIPNKGGLKVLFTGDSSMQVFGADLAAFGKGFKKYYNSVKGINMDVVDPSLAAAKSLAAFSNNIHNTSRLKSIFMGDNSMATFGEQLVTFGEYFAEYVDNLKDVKTGDVAIISNQLNTLISSINAVSEDTVNSTANLASTMKSLAGISFKDIKDAFDQKEDDFNGLGSKVIRWLSDGMKAKTNMNPVAEKLAKNFLSVLKSAFKAKRDDMGSGVGKELCKAITAANSKMYDYKDDLYKTAQSLIQNGVIAGVRDTYKEVQESAKYIGTGIVTGLKSKQGETKRAGMNLASAVDKGFRVKAEIKSPSRRFKKNAMYVVKGLTNELKRRKKEVFNAGSNTGKALDDGMRDYLGIHSPAKKGQETAKWYEIGIFKTVAEELKNVRKAGSDTGEALNDGAKNAIDSGSDSIEKSVKKSGKKVAKAYKKIASDAYITVKATTKNAKKLIKQAMASLNDEKSFRFDKDILASYKALYKAYKGTVKATSEGIYKKSSQYKKDLKIIEDHKKALSGLYETQKKLKADLAKAKPSEKSSIAKQLEDTAKAIADAEKQIKADTKMVNKHIKNAFGKKARNDITNFAKALYLESDQYKEDAKNIKQHQKALNDLYRERAKLQNQLGTTKKKDKSSIKSTTKSLKENAKEISKAQKQLIKDQETVRNNIKKTLQEYRDGIRDTLKEYMKLSSISIDIGLDTFSEFGSSVDLTVEDLLNNMKSQVTGFHDIEDGLNELAKNGLSKGLIDKLRDMGTDAAGYIALFRKMTTKEIKQANATFKEQTTITKETLFSKWEKTQTDAKKWRNGLIKLLNRGFNIDLVKEIQGMGISSGMTYVEALTSCTDKEKDKINREYVKTLGLSESLSDDIVASWAKNGKKVGKHVGKIATNTAKATTKDVEKKVTPTVSKAVQKLQKKLKEASDALQEEYKKIEAVSEELATNVKSNLESFMSITSLSMDTGISDLFSEFTFEQWDYTLDMFIDNMESQIDGIRFVENGLKELENLDFCDGFINYLKGLGPQAAQYITEFRTATAEQVKRTNEIFANYSKMSKESLLDSAADKKATVTAWSNNMQTLIANNLNPEILKQLAEQGPDSADLVAAYASMTPEEIKQINQYYIDTLKMSDDVSKEIAKSYEEQGKKAAKSLYDATAKGIQDKIDAENSKKSTKKKGTISGSISKLGKAAKKALEAMLNGEDGDELKKTAGGIALAIGTGIDNKKDTVKKKAKSTGKAASDALKSGCDKNTASTAGSALGTALAAGLLASKDEVVSAANEIVNAANSALAGLKSPSIGNSKSGTTKMQYGLITNPSKNTTKKAASATAASVKNSNSSKIANKLGGLGSGALSSNITNIFNQTNNSPKSLSNAEIYRNTKNLFANVKGALS